MRIGRKVWLIICVLLGFSIAVGIRAAPTTWRPSPGLVFSVCPAAMLSISVDPSWLTVLVLLAPINAALYGAVGVVLAWIFDRITLALTRAY